MTNDSEISKEFWDLKRRVEQLEGKYERMDMEIGDLRNYSLSVGGGFSDSKISGGGGAPDGKLAAIVDRIIGLEHDRAKIFVELARWNRVMGQVKKQSPEDFHIFEMYFLDGLKQDAIAAKVGYSTKTVGRKLDSITEKIVDLMSD